MKLENLSLNPESQNTHSLNQSVLLPSPSPPLLSHSEPAVDSKSPKRESHLQKNLITSSDTTNPDSAVQINYTKTSNNTDQPLARDSLEKSLENDKPSSSNAEETATPQEIEPILSRRAKKKRARKASAAKAAADDKLAVDTPPIVENTIEAPPEKQPTALVQDVPPLDNYEPEVSNDEPEVSKTDLSKEIEQLELTLEAFPQLLEKAAFYVGQLEEAGISHLSNAAELCSFVEGIDAVTRTMCTLITMNDQQQPQVPNDIVDALADSLQNVLKIANVLEERVKARIESIKKNQSRRKSRKMIVEWKSLLDAIGDLTRNANRGLTYYTENFAVSTVENVVEEVADESKSIDSSVNTFDRQSVEGYLERLLTAVHDFVYVPEIQDVKKRGALKKFEANQADPWIALAAAIGLDPGRFNFDQQISLIQCIQKEFPDPKELVSLIIENPTDPRLDFDLLLKQFALSGSGGISTLEARVSVLEQQLLQKRLIERKWESKLVQVKSRNNSWLHSMGYPLSFRDGTGFDGESVSESEWVDDDVE